jgi:hypothetical protein
MYTLWSRIFPQRPQRAADNVEQHTSTANVPGPSKMDLWNFVVTLQDHQQEMHAQLMNKYAELRDKDAQLRDKDTQLRELKEKLNKATTPK